MNMQILQDVRSTRQRLSSKPSLNICNPNTNKIMLMLIRPCWRDYWQAEQGCLRTWFIWCWIFAAHWLTHIFTWCLQLVVICCDINTMTVTQWEMSLWSPANDDGARHQQMSHHQPRILSHSRVIGLDRYNSMQGFTHTKSESRTLNNDVIGWDSLHIHY